MHVEIDASGRHCRGTPEQAHTVSRAAEQASPSGVSTLLLARAESAYGSSSGVEGTGKEGVRLEARFRARAAYD